MVKTKFKLLAIALMVGFASCDDFLDSEPESSVDPDKYFAEVSQLQAYADEIYPRIFFADNRCWRHIMRIVK